MAPLRNRATRVQNDQDQIFEGLPIRNWRRVEATIGPQSEEQPLAGTSHWPELPMPRDSHLLSDMSRQLLRIARAPRVSKRSEPAEDEEKDNVEEVEAKDDSGGFTIKKWVQMPKGYDEPEREYLAKRRKGLPPIHEGYIGVYGPLGVSKAFRTLKVRRTDANGVEHVYEVMAQVGQVVEGEILENEKDAAAPVEPPAAPGTVIEGVGVVNAEGVVVAQSTPKRKPPPPRRKSKKGTIGRSKKKLMPEIGPDGAPIHPPPSMNGGVSASDAVDSAAQDTENGDTPMPDAADDDEEGSGEEGDDMDEDEDGREEGELSAASTPAEAQQDEPKLIPPELASKDDDPPESTPSFQATVPPPAQTEIPLDPFLETSNAMPGVLSSSPHLPLPVVESSPQMSEMPISDVPTNELPSLALDSTIPSSADVQLPAIASVITSSIDDEAKLSTGSPLPVVETAPIPAVEAVPLPVAETAPISVVEAAPTFVAEAAPILAVEAAPILAVEAAPILVTETAPILMTETAPLPVLEPDPQPAPVEPIIPPDMTTPPAPIPEPLAEEAEPPKMPTPPAAPIIPHAELAILPDPPTLPITSQSPPVATEKGEAVLEKDDMDLLGSLEAQLDSAGKQEGEPKEAVDDNEMQIDKAGE